MLFWGFSNCNAVAFFETSFFERSSYFKSVFSHNNITVLISKVQNNAVAYYTCQIFWTYLIFLKHFLHSFIFWMHTYLFKNGFLKKLKNSLEGASLNRAIIHDHPRPLTTSIILAPAPMTTHNLPLFRHRHPRIYLLLYLLLLLSSLFQLAICNSIKTNKNQPSSLYKK